MDQYELHSCMGVGAGLIKFVTVSNEYKALLLLKKAHEQLGMVTELKVIRKDYNENVPAMLRKQAL